MSQVVKTETEWTPAQLKLITDVVARNASQDELKLFLYRCKSMGLDPLKPGQVHFIKYGNGPGTIVVGIEGFRSIAARTGKLSGIERGVTKDEQGKLIGGWAKVYRHDWQHPAKEEVPFSEYTTGKGAWSKMPETMIKKVAEAAALRMAFPDHLGGVYAEEEMDQASRGTVFPDQPTSEDGIIEEGYIVPHGPSNLIRKPIHRCDPAALKDMVEQIEAKEKNTGKAMPEWAVEFIKQAEPYIAKWERQEAAKLKEPGWEG